MIDDNFQNSCAIACAMNSLEVGGCSTGKSFRFVCACVRAVMVRSVFHAAITTRSWRGSLVFSAGVKGDAEL